MKKAKIIDFGINLLMIVLAFIWIYPYLWLLLSSFKPVDEIFTRFLPTRITFEHYKFIFVTSERLQRPFVRALFNSVFISVSVTTLVILTSCLVGYALSRIDFKGARITSNFILFQMLFPGFMFLIPLFVLMRTFGLLDSYMAVIFPSAMSAWGIFMFSQSFKTIPQDYVDAAKMDGANRLWVIFRVLLPLSRTTASIVGLFTFIGIWDNFLWPLMVIKNPNRMPLAVLLAVFNHQYAGYIGPVLAGAVLQTIPMLIIFWILRDYFIKGIAFTLK